MNHYLFYTGQTPVKEMLSAVDPALLGPGQFSLLDNLSIAKGKVTARNGCARLAAAPIANASFRGAWFGYLGGQYTMLVAFRVSSATYVYRLSSSHVYTELTGASTRFATDGYIDFAPFTERGLIATGTQYLYPQDGVLMGNGTDECGIAYYNSQTLNYGFARVANATPSDNAPASSQANPGGYWIIKDKDNTAYTNSGANFTMADSGSSDTENEIVVTLSASASIGDTSIVNFSTNGVYDGVSGSLKLTEAKQLHILIEDTISDPIFNYVDLEVYNSSNTTYYQLHNASSPNFIVTQADTGVYMVSFNLDLANADIANWVSLQRVRLTVDRVPSATRTANIIGIFTGGNVDGTSEYIVSYLLESTRVESSGIAATQKSPPIVSEVGGSDARRITLVAPFGTYWKHYIYFVNPTSVSGADLAVFYRRDPDSDLADYFVSSVYSLTIIGAGVNTKRDNTRSDLLDYGRKAPSAFTIKPPKAKRFAAGANRLFAGGSSSEPTKVYISDEGFPMRFTSIPRDSDGDGYIDPDSGTSVSFPGETIQRIQSMPGSVVGVSPMAVFTNKNVWRVEGIDALSLSRATIMNPNGTLYPWTVAKHKDSFYYIDSEKQPVKLDGGSPAVPLGIWKIEDQLQSGDPTNSYGVVFAEAYKVAYRASGASVNQKVLNYEERLDGWHRHTYINPDWAGYVLEETSSGRKLLGITTTGEVFEIEQASKTADDQKTGSSTDDISITMTTGEIHPEMWTGAKFGKVALLCEKASGRTLTITRADPSNSSNESSAPVGVIDCSTNVNDRAWRYDQTNDSDKRECGMKAQSCLVTISGAWTPGKLLKGAYMIIEDAPNLNPDVAG